LVSKTTTHPVPDQALIGLYAETPLTTSETGAPGTIDLTVQRSAVNDLPVILSRNLKQAVNARLELHRAGSLTDGDCHDWPALESALSLVGEHPASEISAPGWLSVSDARVAAFPVPCLQSMMRWVTSPTMLSGLARLATVAEIPTPPVPVTHTKAIASPSEHNEHLDVVVGLTSLVRSTNSEALEGRSQWAQWMIDHLLPAVPSFDFTRSKLSHDLVIVPDNTITKLTRDFSHAVVGNELSGSRAVKHLFTKESLPAETVMMSLLAATEGVCLVSELEFLDDSAISLGGTTNLDHGLIWTHLTGRPKTEADGAYCAATSEATY